MTPAYAARWPWLWREPAGFEEASGRMPAGAQRISGWGHRPGGMGHCVAMPSKSNLGTSISRCAAFGCGGLLSLFGITMIGGGMLSFGEKGKVAGDLTMMLLFGLVPLAIGVCWIYRAGAARRREAWEIIERKVLQIAMQHGGVVTAMEVAAQTDLSFEETERYLDRLADRGHVQVTPSDKGLAYRFPGADANAAAPAADLHLEAPRGRTDESV